MSGGEMEVEDVEFIMMSDVAVTVVELLESIAGVARIEVGLEMRRRFDGVSSCGTSVAVRLTGE